MDAPISRELPKGEWFKGIKDAEEGGEAGDSAVDYATTLAEANALQHLRLDNVKPHFHFLVSDISWVQRQKSERKNQGNRLFTSLGAPVLQPLPGFSAHEYTAVTEELTDKLNALRANGSKPSGLKSGDGRTRQMSART